MKAKKNNFTLKKQPVLTLSFSLKELGSIEH